MQMLLGLAGKARVGKDTIGEYLSRKHDFQRAAFAGPLKAMLAIGLGLRAEDFQTTQQKESVIPWLGLSYRHCAQTLGTEWGRDKIHEDLWLKVMQQRWKGLCGTLSTPRLVITDVRFENEAHWIREAGGTVVHVMTNRESELDAKARSHVSEGGVGYVTGDRIVQNYYATPTPFTLQALYGSVEAMMDNLFAVKA